MKNGTYEALGCSEVEGAVDANAIEISCDAMTKQHRNEGKEMPAKQPEPSQFGSNIGSSVLPPGGPIDGTSPKPCLLPQDPRKTANTTLEKRVHPHPQIIMGPSVMHPGGVINETGPKPCMLPPDPDPSLIKSSTRPTVKPPGGPCEGTSPKPCQLPPDPNPSQFSPSTEPTVKHPGGPF